MTKRVVIAAVIVGWTSLASAQPKTAAELFSEGQQRYAAGEYLIAADRFEAAYALDPDPAYLFNVAQAYRFGNACAKAATSYKKFLDTVPNPPNVAKVQQYLEQAEDCAKKQAAAQRPPPPPPDANVVQPPPPPPPATDEAHPGRAQRIAGLGIAGFGVVALGVAGYYTYKVYDYADQRSNLCAAEIAAHTPCDWGAQNREARENELDDLGHSAQTRARIGWIVGGAAVIGGVALYLIGKNTAYEHATVALVPTADGAMAVSAFSF